MKNKKHLFVISTALSLASAQNYVRQFELKNESLALKFLLYDPLRVKGRLHQIYKTMDMLMWKDFQIVPLGFGKLLGLVNFIRIMFLAMKYRHVDVIYCQNLNQRSSRLLIKISCPKKVVLLDDGLLTVSTSQRRNDSHSNNTKLQLFEPKSIYYYSQFNLEVRQPDQVIEYVAISALRNSVKLRKRVFFGQPLVELGFIGQKEFTQVVELIFNTNRHEWSYVPHPRESVEMLSLLPDSVEVCYLENIPELEYVNNPALFQVVESVHSFFSSVLLTLSPVLSKDVEIIMYRLEGGRYLQGCESPAVHDFFEYATTHCENSKIVSV